VTVHLPNPKYKPNPIAGARFSLALLVGINLFNFIDRYVLASVEPSIRATFFSPNNPNAMWWSGMLSTAFVVTYMLSAPALGWLADRFSRWVIIGIAVIVWTLATAASGLATSIAVLFVARIFVGIGEGAYGPAAPPIISESFPITARGTMLAIFFAAGPAGSAVGYILGGLLNAHMGWRSAFYIASGPGLLLGLLCFLRKDSRTKTSSEEKPEKTSLKDYLQMVKVLVNRPSYGFNVAAQAAMAFSLGGVAYWMPAYLQFRLQPSSATALFGGVTAVAGLSSTLVGGFLADRLRARLPGSDLLISGVGMLVGFPLFAAMLYVPFPFAWICLFCALFFIFFNIGASNAAVANVSLPSVRATAFALNIFVMHALGDAPAPPLLGFVAGHTNMNTAFLAMSAVMLISGVLWLIGARYLPADSAAVEATNACAPMPPASLSRSTTTPAELAAG
jgi:MFS transporter, Spinster family, sphingosine-1-phosphate transporter